MKIALEERKILIAQRKLESMRLLEELFNRVKVISILILSLLSFLICEFNVGDRNQRRTRKTFKRNQGGRAQTRTKRS